MKILKVLKINLLVICTFVLFSLFTIGEVSAATTYYVAKTGNDSNVGSATAPFKTIQKAASIVNPGDTVIVKDGIYTDTYAPGYMLYLTRSGTADNWITFKSENKWGAVIDGQNTAECVSFTRNSKYIRIEDFEIKNCTVAIISADVPPATNVYIYRNHIHSLSHHAIDLADGNNYWTIDSNIIHGLDTTNPDWNTYGVYVAGDTSNTTIINNVFYDIRDGWLIHLYNHGSPDPQNNTKIINNTFADESPNFTGQIIVAAISPNLLIENNIFYNPTTSAIRAYYNNSGKNVIVRNNLNNVGSMCSGTYCNDLTFTNNQTGTNPSFVDHNNRNYHLQSVSPAINVGIYYADRSSDADGNPIVGAPDIGAYEYVGSSSLPSGDTTSPAPPNIMAIQ